jgi:rSAM/selenodomain-associated transferase 1
MIDAVAVIVMSKYPSPGRVKTRLLPELSAEQAAAVHRALLLHTVGRLRLRAPGRFVLAFDPPAAEADFRSLLGGDLPGVQLIAQGDGDLGRRIARIHAALSGIHPRQLFLGVDSPDLPADHLSQAATLARGAQVTLGPTADGGYWCLGLDRSVDAGSLLGGIDWSSGHEAEQTVARARTLGYSLAMAGGWDDIDRFDDLRRVLDRLAASPAAEDRRLRAALGQIVNQRVRT